MIFFNQTTSQIFIIGLFDCVSHVVTIFATQMFLVLGKLLMLRLLVSRLLISHLFVLWLLGPLLLVPRLLVLRLPVLRLLVLRLLVLRLVVLRLVVLRLLVTLAFTNQINLQFEIIRSPIFLSMNIFLIDEYLLHLF